MASFTNSKYVLKKYPPFVSAFDNNGTKKPSAVFTFPTTIQIEIPKNFEIEISLMQSRITKFIMAELDQYSNSSKKYIIDTFLQDFDNNFELKPSLYDLKRHNFNSRKEAFLKNVYNLEKNDESLQFLNKIIEKIDNLIKFGFLKK